MNMLILYLIITASILTSWYGQWKKQYNNENLNDFIRSPGVPYIPMMYGDEVQTNIFICDKYKISDGSRNMERNSHIMVAAIDFGTSFSTWGYSFNYDYDLEPTRITVKQWTGLQSTISLKGPTSILIESDGKTLDSFGFDAETRYAELVEDSQHKEWYYYKRFKMQLFDKIGLRRDFTINDATGKPLRAKTVFSISIRYLKDDLIRMSKKQLLVEQLENKDIQWVLTVPAIWNDVTKQFMREAATDAGLKTENLTIALEPECASIYCRLISATKTQISLGKLPVGSKYIILDAGGGTVDITAHQIMPEGILREIHRATGGDWGGTKVDQAFENFLNEITGDGVMDAFKDKAMGEYLELMTVFEVKKRETKAARDRKVTIKIPVSLNELVERTETTVQNKIQLSKYKDKVKFATDKVILDPDIMRGFFEDSIESIIKHLEELFRVPQLEKCQVILMVGGYSDSSILQKRIRSHFQDKTVITPTDAGLAVLKGAVIFGHNPSLIAERICRFTYGTATTHIKKKSCTHRRTKSFLLKGKERCTDLFDIHVRAGDTVKVGEWRVEKTYTPVYRTQTIMAFDIYCTKEHSPELVTDEGCVKLGEVTLPVPKTKDGIKREVLVSFLFGYTELEVKVHDKTSGTERKISFSLID